MNELILMNYHQRSINQSHIQMHFYDGAYKTEHVHQTWEIVCVTAGEILHIFNGERRIMTKGEVILIRPGDRHLIDVCGEKSGQHLSMQIVDDYAQKYMALLDENLYAYLLGSPENRVTLNPVEFDYVFQAAKAGIQMRDVDWRTYMSHIKVLFVHFFHLFLKGMREADKSPFWLSDFIQKLQNLPDYSIPVKELTKFTDYSYTHLRRVFKQYMNTTLAEYFTRIKLNKAQLLLCETDKKIIDVAESLGYYSLSHFNKLFQYYNGITPSKYRARYKKSSKT